MSQKQFSPEENNDLLSLLFNQEQLEREGIASSIHNLAGKLSGAKIFAALLRSSDETKNLAVKNTEMAIQSCIDDLRILMYQVYPREIARIGLISHLLNRCDALAKQYTSKINVITSINDRLQIDIQQEVELYKLCSNVLEYLCLLSIPEIETTLVEKEDTLIIQLVGNGIEPGLTVENELSEKLSLIKARLVFLKAEILSDTNWKNTFEFKFHLNRKK